MIVKMREKHCCWNEEKQEWYLIESIGINRFMYLGCYKEDKKWR